MRWWAPTSKTVGTFGHSESVIEIGGGLAYRLIAQFFFNYTNNEGYAHGTRIETVTATADYSLGVVVATTGGSPIRLSC